jgi:hypothetical protein
VWLFIVTSKLTEFYNACWFSVDYKLVLQRVNDKKIVEEQYINDGNEIFSQRVKAGKRTYFFDIKATRSEDFYLTITEVRKKQGYGGEILKDKQKIFLYKEDFEKFVEAMNNSYDKVKELLPEFDFKKAAENNYNGDSDGIKWE